MACLHFAFSNYFCNFLLTFVMLTFHQCYLAFFQFNSISLHGFMYMLAVNCIFRILIAWMNVILHILIMFTMFIVSESYLSYWIHSVISIWIGFCRLNKMKMKASNHSPEFDTWKILRIDVVHSVIIISYIKKTIFIFMSNYVI